MDDVHFRSRLQLAGVAALGWIRHGSPGHDRRDGLHYVFHRGRFGHGQAGSGGILGSSSATHGPAVDIGDSFKAPHFFY